MGGFIVGFDSDGPEIFAQQRELLGRQPVPLAMAGILTALPGTALWRRLKAEVSAEVEASRLAPQTRDTTPKDLDSNLPDGTLRPNHRTSSPAVLRNSQRRHVRNGKHEVWHSFFAKDLPGPLDSGFGSLLAFDELRLQPGASTEPHCEDETEILTYVYKGALSQEDTLGNSGVIHTGEFQRMSPGRRIRHKETSVSQSDWVHMFRISIRPSEIGVDREHEQKRFTAAQRHNLLCVVGSPDGRKGSLPIHQDVLVFSAILDPGHHLVHELAPGRTAWLHLVCGEAALDDIVLTQGDGVGISNEPSVSLTVQENTEILLVDLGQANLRPWKKTHRGNNAIPHGGETIL
jgi:redox-sensitive bicupin YhaK (pirin superfamily)